MTDGLSNHKLLSHTLLSTFGCYEYAENMKNNSKSKTNLYLEMKTDISKNTSLMFLSCFLTGLANNSPISKIFLADKLHTQNAMVLAPLVRFIL